MINRHRIRRMMAPAVGLRRSVATLLAGLAAFLFGFALSFRLLLLPAIERLAQWWTARLGNVMPSSDVDQTIHLVGGGMLLLGFYLSFVGVRGALRAFMETLNPGQKGRMVNIYVRRQQLANGPRIVALGGGTGLSTLLRGLKQHSSNITAIVTVTDDGGSSGRLVQEMGIIPPGDIRNCLVALADAEKLMTDVFQHRFRTNRGPLAGHSLGNLLIAGLMEQCDGDVERALAMASAVLNIRGRVIPSTLEHVHLRALLEDGEELCGETTIVAGGRRIRRLYLEPETAAAFPDAIAAIQEADLICIGPGSVYTSVIPNLLVGGISEAIQASPAVKAYICNVMTQPGESDSFTAAEHLTAIQANVPGKIVDCVLVNTGVPSSFAVDRYAESDQFLVESDVDRVRAMGYRVVAGNFMHEQDYVRHDPFKVAARLVSLLEK